MEIGIFIIDVKPPRLPAAVFPRFVLRAEKPSAMLKYDHK
jgi:hypothetical protein